MKRAWCFEAGLFVGLWLLLAGIAPHKLFNDPGTFWHTRIGQDSFATGALPLKDTFTFTARGKGYATAKPGIPLYDYLDNSSNWKCIVLRPKNCGDTPAYANTSTHVMLSVTVSVIELCAIMRNMRDAKLAPIDSRVYSRFRACRYDRPWSS